MENKKKRRQKSLKLCRKKKTAVNYNVKNVQDALTAIEKDNLTVRQAAEKFKVPKSTLHDKLKFKTSISAKKGPQTYLTQEEEERIVDWILECSVRGFPVTKEVERLCSKVYYRLQERNTIFKWSSW